MSPSLAAAAVDDHCCSSSWPYWFTDWLSRHSVYRFTISLFYDPPTSSSTIPQRLLWWWMDGSLLRGIFIKETDFMGNNDPWWTMTKEAKYKNTLGRRRRSEPEITVPQFNMIAWELLSRVTKKQMQTGKGGERSRGNLISATWNVLLPQ